MSPIGIISRPSGALRWSNVKCTVSIGSQSSPIPAHVLRRCLMTLAIETSCDDTGVAIVEKVNGQAKLHFNERITSNNTQFGGIHPLVSLEAHQENLAGLVERALSHLPSHHEDTSSRTLQVSPGRNGNKRLPDFISVTRGPGMRSSLQTGLDTAKGLAVAWQVPLVGVHHMQAHALTPRLASALDAQERNVSEEQIHPEFPFLSLLVSGGHTLLLQSQDLVTHRVLADTDIAVGDCLDKIARAILPEDTRSSASNTSYGALLEQFAFGGRVSDPSQYDYQPPKTRNEEIIQSNAPSQFGWPFAAPFTTGKAGAKLKSLEFSFTGVASYATQLAANGWDTVKNTPSKKLRGQPIAEDEARWLARESMRVCFEHLATRIILALKQEETLQRPSSKTLVLSGGVSANKFLRHVLKSFLTVRGYPDIEVIAPPLPLCTDNAAMIGWTGIEMYEAGHVGDFKIRSLRRWSLENILTPENEEEFSGVAYEALRRSRMADKKSAPLSKTTVSEPASIHRETAAA